MNIDNEIELVKLLGYNTVKITDKYYEIVNDKNEFKGNIICDNNLISIAISDEEHDITINGIKNTKYFIIIFSKSSCLLESANKVLSLYETLITLSCNIIIYHSLSLAYLNIWPHVTVSSKLKFLILFILIISFLPYSLQLH